MLWRFCTKKDETLHFRRRVVSKTATQGCAGSLWPTWFALMRFFNSSLSKRSSTICPAPNLESKRVRKGFGNRECCWRRRELLLAWTRFLLLKEIEIWLLLLWLESTAAEHGLLTSVLITVCYYCRTKSHLLHMQLLCSLVLSSVRGHAETIPGTSDVSLHGWA